MIDRWIHVMSDSKLVKNTIFYSLGEILPRAISFILLPVYTSYLSPADYGIISYIHTIVLLLYVLGAFALNSYVLRYYFIHNNEEDRKTLLGTIQLSIISLNTILLILAFLLMPEIINRFNIQVPWNPFFRMAFIINFFDCLSIIPLVIYRVRQDAIKFVILGFSRTILTVGLTLYFLVVEERGLLGTFQAQLYVVIPYAVIYLLIMQKYARWKVNWGYIKEGIKFSSPLIPGSICYILLSVSDRVILERNVNISELGVYNVACQLALVLNIIIQSGYKAIEPELFRRFGQVKFYEFICKTQSIFFCIIYVGALALCLFSQEFFMLMTSNAFHGGYMLVPALIVGVIMTGQNVIYGGVLQGERRTKVVGAATIVGAIISVLLNLSLIPVLGTYAAAITSSVSFFVMNLILFFSMTFPNKSMIRETFLVLLVPLISYLLFYLYEEISVQTIVIKFIILCLYGLLGIKSLQVDMKIIKGIIYKKADIWNK